MTSGVPDNVIQVIEDITNTQISIQISGVRSEIDKLETRLGEDLNRGNEEREILEENILKQVEGRISDARTQIEGNTENHVIQIFKEIEKQWEAWRPFFNSHTNSMNGIENFQRGFNDSQNALHVKLDGLVESFEMIRRNISDIKATKDITDLRLIQEQVAAISQESKARRIAIDLRISNNHAEICGKLHQIQIEIQSLTRKDSPSPFESPYLASDSEPAIHKQAHSEDTCDHSLWQEFELLAENIDHIQVRPQAEVQEDATRPLSDNEVRDEVMKLRKEMIEFQESILSENSRIIEDVRGSLTTILQEVREAREAVVSSPSLMSYLVHAWISATVWYRVLFAQVLHLASQTRAIFVKSCSSFLGVFGELHPVLLKETGSLFEQVKYFHLGLRSRVEPKVLSIGLRWRNKRWIVASLVVPSLIALLFLGWMNGGDSHLRPQSETHVEGTIRAKFDITRWFSI